MNLQPTTYNLQPARGFTLVETMVAVFVMMMAIVAPMSIASKALSTARYAKEQVIAFYLAQDGIELARSIRDNNVLGGRVWNEGQSGTNGYLGNSATGNESVCYSESGCRIDAKDLVVSDCIGGCPVLNIDSGGIYSYSQSGITPSEFTRTIKLTKISDTEIKISSSVSWISSLAGGIKSFVITDVLTHWQ